MGASRSTPAACEAVGVVQPQRDPAADPGSTGSPTSKMPVSCPSEKRGLRRGDYHRLQRFHDVPPAACRSASASCPAPWPCTFSRRRAHPHQLERDPEKSRDHRRTRLPAHATDRCTVTDAGRRSASACQPAMRAYGIDRDIRLPGQQLLAQGFIDRGHQLHEHGQVGGVHDRCGRAQMGAGKWLPQSNRATTCQCTCATTLPSEARLTLVGAGAHAAWFPPR